MLIKKRELIKKKIRKNKIQSIYIEQNKNFIDKKLFSNYLNGNDYINFDLINNDLNNFNLDQIKDLLTVMYSLVINKIIFYEYEQYLNFLLNLLSYDYDNYINLKIINNLCYINNIGNYSYEKEIKNILIKTINKILNEENLILNDINLILFFLIISNIYDKNIFIILIEKFYIDYQIKYDLIYKFLQNFIFYISCFIELNLNNLDNNIKIKIKEFLEKLFNYNYKYNLLIFNQLDYIVDLAFLKDNNFLNNNKFFMKNVLEYFLSKLKKNRELISIIYNILNIDNDILEIIFEDEFLVELLDNFKNEQNQRNIYYNLIIFQNLFNFNKSNIKIIFENIEFIIEKILDCKIEKSFIEFLKLFSLFFNEYFYFNELLNLNFWLYFYRYFSLNKIKKEENIDYIYNFFLKFIEKGKIYYKNNLKEFIHWITEIRFFEVFYEFFNTKNIYDDILQELNN